MEVSKNKALKCIQEMYTEIPNLKKFKEDSEEYSQWKYKTDNVIKGIFGETSSEYSSMHNRLFPEYVGLPMGVHVDYQRAYQNRLDSLFAQLKGFENAIGLWEDDIIPNDNDAISILSTILPRFHKFARQLKHRYNGKNCVEIIDEYDVQYLLHAILKLHFEDVRKEENIPSYAGSSARADFLLKKEKIIIEVKKTRSHLKDKELGNQLSLDKEHYSVHPDCETLVCFIYDPDELLSNPIGLINDLSKPNSEMKTMVIVSPNYK